MVYEKEYGVMLALTPTQASIAWVGPREPRIVFLHASEGRRDGYLGLTGIFERLCAYGRIGSRV